MPSVDLKIHLDARKFKEAMDSIAKAFQEVSPVFKRWGVFAREARKKGDRHIEWIKSKRKEERDGR